MRRNGQGAAGGAPGKGGARPAGARGGVGASAHAGAGKPARAVAGAPARVRIIGGAWKRTPLPVADVPGLRPTPDRVRETLFNWLGRDLEGWRCADLFAGTGALGFEAASRGAAEVVLVEQDRRALAGLHEAQAKLAATAVRIVPADAMAAVQRLAAERAGQFDLVLLDPPFGLRWPERIVPAAARLLAPGGLLYLEAEAPPDEALARVLAEAGLEPLRAGRAGQVHYHLYCGRADEAAGAAPGS